MSQIEAEETETQTQIQTHPLSQAIHEIYADVIRGIADIYDQIGTDLNKQRAQLMKKLNVWEDIHCNKYKYLDCKISNNNFRAIHKIYKDSKLDIQNEVFNINDDKDIESQNDISKILYSMIKSKIYQDFNNKNPTKYVSNVLHQTIDYQQHDFNMNNINDIVQYENVKMFLYQQNKWRKIGIGKIRFNLDFKVLIFFFKHSEINKILSYQSINNDTTSNIKQPKENEPFVHWTGFDQYQSGKCCMFLAKFQDQDQAKSFTQNMRILTN